MRAGRGGGGGGWGGGGASYACHAPVDSGGCTGWVHLLYREKSFNTHIAPNLTSLPPASRTQLPSLYHAGTGS